MPNKPQHRLSVGFWRTLWQLLVLLRPFPALFLVLLSVIEAVLVSKVGQIAGQYYLIIVDQQHSLFIRTTLVSAALYLCNTVAKSTSQWLAELLAYRWRGTLTRVLQRHYCHDEQFFWLSASNDNPDQRITQDTSMFCNNLGSITRVIAAAPFQVVYYTYWTYSITSGYVILAVYSFFLASLLIESAIVRPIARVVFKQEQMEGNFRFAHMRLRTFLTEAALYRAGAAEGAALEAALLPVLSNQLRLVMWRWLLTACTTGLEYAGALLNYTCIALVIFTGCLPVDMDKGQVAKWVSNASFATLTLIFSFTQLLDLASQFSTLAGVTLRVGQLLQELQVLETSTPASDTHRAGFGSAAADERVPLLGFRSCDPHYAPNTPESSHRQQPLSTAGQLHTSLSQLHSHPALQDQSTSLSRQHELQQQQQQQQQQVPRGVPGADAQQGDAALQHSHHALHQEFSLSHAQDSGGVRRQAVATAQDLSCLRPDGKLLFRHVSFQVHPGLSWRAGGAGELVLVVGPSGGGKSTLVQALAGLWPLAQGHTCLPLPHLVQVMPQRPVAAPGSTLMEQIIYPSPLPEPLDHVDEHQLAHVLQQVGLSELLQRVQGDWMLSQDWQGMLSPGELQRLSFARILFHHPVLAIMDEPVSCVGIRAGLDLLQLLQQSRIGAIVTGQSDGPLANESTAANLFSQVVLLHQ